MSGGKIIAVVVVVFGLIAGLSLLSMYNNIIRSENAIVKSWADVQSAYQRRLDLIPRIAKVAKFSVDAQIKLNTEVAKLRENYQEAATPVKIDEINDTVKGLMINVRARAEASPNFDTSQLTELNSAMDSVERVINHQRDGFNEMVRRYNNRIETFPGSVVASWFGFSSKESFRAQAGAEKAPDINLDFSGEK